jgi:D-amino-acid dehydrogenase
MNSLANLATQSRPILVIGGGVIGLCCAYSLRAAGIPVMLCEQSSYGSGASSGNLGLLAVSHSVPLASPGVISQALRWWWRSNSPLGISFPPSPDLLRWLWQFCRASFSAGYAERAATLTHLCLESTELFHELEQSLHFGLRCKGTLEIFSTTKGFQHFCSSVATMRSAGIYVEPLASADVRTLSPCVLPEIAGGAYYSADCFFNPTRFLAAIAGRLHEMGVEMLSSCEVTRLRMQQGQVVAVDLGDTSVEVSGVVLAAGYQTNPLIQSLGLRLPVQPARGYTADFDVAGCVDLPTMFAEAKLLATPMNDRLRIGGYLHLGNTRSLDSRRPVTSKQLAQPLGHYMQEPWTQQLAREVPVWTGVRPCSSDGLPIIGATSRCRNLYIATGHGMLGLTLGPITGKLIAGLLQGEPANPLLSPDRFVCDQSRSRWDSQSSSS